MFIFNSKYLLELEKDNNRLYRIITSMLHRIRHLENKLNIECDEDYSSY